MALSLLEDVPLAPRTTLSAGGPARWLCEARSEDEIRAALSWAGERALPTLVLGGGSNLLVADAGFPGLVIRVRVAGVASRPGPDGAALVEAGAGEPWDALVDRSVASGWAGLECLSGIPGDVGATPIQNVGAYGQEVADTIVSVRAVDRRTGEAAILPREACGFGYRDSIFKREDRDRWVVSSVTFALRPGGAPSLRYAELARAFPAGRAPSLREARDAVIALRRGKSMVLDPADENAKSAGSFFMNPTLDAAAAERVREQARGAGMPEFPASGGRVKLSAGWLIEHAGFAKGYGEGRVGLSTRHALAVVNRGGASAAEIVAFARRVREGRARAVRGGALRRAGAGGVRAGGDGGAHRVAPRPSGDGDERRPAAEDELFTPRTAANRTRDRACWLPRGTRVLPWPTRRGVQVMPSVGEDPRPRDGRWPSGLSSDNVALPMDLPEADEDLDSDPAPRHPPAPRAARASTVAAGHRHLLGGMGRHSGHLAPAPAGPGAGHRRRWRTRRLEHVELQLEMTADVPFRIYEYHTLLSLALAAETPFLEVGLPRIRSTLVLLSGREKPWPEEGEYRTSPDDVPFSGVSFRIDAVYQRTVAELAARGSTLWMIFAPLAIDADPDRMKVVLQDLRAQTSPREFGELAAALTVVAGKDKRRKGLREAILGLLSEEDVMENWVFKLGEQRGEQRGEQQGAQRSLARLYEKKLGRPLTTEERASLSARIQTLGVDRIEDALLALSPEALRAWLHDPSAA